MLHALGRLAPALANKPAIAVGFGGAFGSGGRGSVDVSITTNVRNARHFPLRPLLYLEPAPTVRRAAAASHNAQRGREGSSVPERSAGWQWSLQWKWNQPIKV